MIQEDVNFVNQHLTRFLLQPEFEPWTLSEQTGLPHQRVAHHVSLRKEAPLSLFESQLSPTLPYVIPLLIFQQVQACIRTVFRNHFMHQISKFAYNTIPRGRARFPVIQAE